MIPQQCFTPHLPDSGFLTQKLGWLAPSEEGPAMPCPSPSPFLPTRVIYHAKLPVVRDGVHGGGRKGSKRCSASLSDISLIVYRTTPGCQRCPGRDFMWGKGIAFCITGVTWCSTSSINHDGEPALQFLPSPHLDRCIWFYLDLYGYLRFTLAL